VANDQIDRMAQGFKDMGELQAYSSAQFQTIIKLNAKIKELNNEIDSLKNILAKSTPLLEQDTKGLIINPFQMSIEEQICVVQLRRLNEISNDRLLTKEESQQLDIYTKSLNTIRTSPKTISTTASKDLTEKELLKLIESDNESSKTF